MASFLCLKKKKLKDERYGFVQKICLKRGSQRATADGYQGQGDLYGLRLDLTFPMTCQPDGCLWTPFPTASFPSSLHTDSKYHAQSSEPLFLLCPKLLHCHVLLFCIKFHHISVAQDLVGAAPEEAEALSPYCFVLYISILKPNTCSLLNFHDVLLPQMRKVTQSCETAQGNDGVLQDLSFFVSNPVFKLRVHKQKLLSTQHLPPHHQEELLRLTPRVV